jgi:uncharacterized protein YebE (UPF0316 family)
MYVESVKIIIIGASFVVICFVRQLKLIINQINERYLYQNDKIFNRISYILNLKSVDKNENKQDENR